MQDIPRFNKQCRGADKYQLKSSMDPSETILGAGTNAITDTVTIPNLNNNQNGKI